MSAEQRHNEQWRGECLKNLKHYNARKDRMETKRLIKKEDWDAFHEKRQAKYDNLWNWD